MSDKDQLARILDEARIEYRSLWTSRVGPAQAFPATERDNFSEAELAAKIQDVEVRQAFVAKAIAMLEANIAHHDELATARLPRDSPTPAR